MDLKALFASPSSPEADLPLKRGITKTRLSVGQAMRIMKLSAIIILSACFTASGNGYSQKVTLSEKNARLEKVFKEIKKQTGYVFFYDASILEGAKPVTINVREVTVEQVLKESLRNQLLEYSIQNKTITIVKKELSIIKEEIALPPPLITVIGRVLNENGEPVEGVSVLVKGSTMGTTTNANGEFKLDGVEESATLIFSSTSIDKVELKVNGKTELIVNVKTAVKLLEETVIKGYYTTTRQLNTGSVGRLGSKEISTQPVSNPLAALTGRVSGLFITQSTGLPGANFSVLIRGRNSIQNGNEPLYLIDGVCKSPQKSYRLKVD